MKEDRKIFAQKIKKLRMDYGLTQEKMANIIGVRKTTICNYESGYAQPTLDTLGNIVKCFNIPYSYLLDKSDVIKRRGQIPPSIIIPFYACNNIEGLMTNTRSQMDSHMLIPTNSNAKYGELMATRAPDNALNNCNIKKGSVIVIERTPYINDGKLVAALKGGNLIIRKFHSDEKGVYLTSESSKVPKALSTEEIPKENFIMLGIITKTILDF